MRKVIIGIAGAVTLLLAGMLAGNAEVGCGIETPVARSVSGF